MPETSDQLKLEKLSDSLIQEATPESKSILPNEGSNQIVPYYLKKNNTSWVFIAGQANKRHLEDILYSVWILLKKNIPKNKIFIFTDHSKAQVILKELDISDSIFELKNIENSYKDLILTEHSIVTVTGHGSQLGIPTAENETISVHRFMKAIRSPKNLKSITLVLCQCYAGIFNYLDVRSTPKVCILGATNLHLSLSFPVDLKKPITINEVQILSNWVANIYMWKFFTWVDLEMDIDGDSLITILDAYKFAGVLTNDDMKTIKKLHAKSIEDLKEKIKNHKADEDPSGEVKKGLEARLEETTNYLYLTQEPWILYPDFGRNLILDIKT